MACIISATSPDSPGASSFGNLRQKQQAAVIFFDLEKAYDTAWKYGILKDLHDAGLRGRLPLFISGFLSDRKFQVRVGGTYSVKSVNKKWGYLREAFFLLLCSV